MLKPGFVVAGLVFPLFLAAPGVQADDGDSTDLGLRPRYSTSDFDVARPLQYQDNGDSAARQALEELSERCGGTPATPCEDPRPFYDHPLGPDRLAQYLINQIEAGREGGHVTHPALFTHLAYTKSEVAHEFLAPVVRVDHPKERAAYARANYALLGLSRASTPKALDLILQGTVHECPSGATPHRWQRQHFWDLKCVVHSKGGRSELHGLEIRRSTDGTRWFERE